MKLVITEHHPDGSARKLKAEEVLWEPSPFFGFKVLNKKPECEYTWEFSMVNPFPMGNKSVTSV